MSSPAVVAAGGDLRLSAGQGHAVAAPEGNLNGRAAQKISINNPDALDPMIKRQERIKCAAWIIFTIAILSLSLIPGALHMAGVISHTTRASLSLGLIVVNIAALLVFMHVYSKQNGKQKQLEACKKALLSEPFRAHIHPRMEYSSVEELLQAHAGYEEREHLLEKKKLNELRIAVCKEEGKAIATSPNPAFLNGRVVQKIAIDNPEALQPLINREARIENMMCIIAFIVMIAMIMIPAGLSAAGIISKNTSTYLMISALAGTIPLFVGFKHSKQKYRLISCRDTMATVPFRKFAQAIMQEPSSIDHILRMHALYIKRCGLEFERMSLRVLLPNNP